MQVAPQPFYYLANFLTALRWVAQRYEDLLSPDERDFIATYQALPVASQALLARLLLRKGPHFRGSALRYPEIGEIETAAAPLLELGWLSTDAPLTIAELHALLRRAELVSIFAQCVDLKRLTKAAMLEALAALPASPQAFRHWCPTLGDELLTLTISDLCERLRLIFFGNLRQDWSEFVLAELGIFRYEAVPIGPESRGFECRQDIDLHMQLHRAREAHEAGAPVFQVLQMIDNLQPTSPLLRTRLAKFRFNLARKLERQADTDTALTLYEQCQYPGARHRRVRIMETGGRLEEALALTETALLAPESDTEEQLLRRSLRRLQSGLGRPPAPVVRLHEHRLDLRLPRSEAVVEMAVREHLNQPEAPVHYVENALINSLFGLLCWDVIFAPLPGAFFHPFHSAPADLHDPDFHGRRRDLFEASLAELESGAYRDTIRQRWQEKYGIQSPFVFWSTLDGTLLEQALHCLPAAHLRVWFERLLLDIRANRCGMPDLIQFWPAEGRYRMIEVKGPGDRLQDNQRRWLELCARHQMPVEVCYVRWAEQ